MGQKVKCSMSTVAQPGPTKSNLLRNFLSTKMSATVATEKYFFHERQIKLSPWQT